MPLANYTAGSRSNAAKAKGSSVNAAIDAHYARIKQQRFAQAFERIASPAFTVNISKKGMSASSGPHASDFAHRRHQRPDQRGRRREMGRGLAGWDETLLDGMVGEKAPGVMRSSELSPRRGVCLKPDGLRKRTRGDASGGTASDGRAGADVSVDNAGQDYHRMRSRTGKRRRSGGSSLSGFSSDSDDGQSESRRGWAEPIHAAYDKMDLLDLLAEPNLAGLPDRPLTRSTYRPGPKVSRMAEGNGSKWKVGKSDHLSPQTRRTKIRRLRMRSVSPGEAGTTSPYFASSVFTTDQASSPSRRSLQEVFDSITADDDTQKLAVGETQEEAEKVYDSGNESEDSFLRCGTELSEVPESSVMGSKVSSYRTGFCKLDAVVVDSIETGQRSLRPGNSLELDEGFSLGHHSNSSSGTDHSISGPKLPRETGRPRRGMCPATIENHTRAFIDMQAETDVPDMMSETRESMVGSPFPSMSRSVGHPNDRGDLASPTGRRHEEPVRYPSPESSDEANYGESSAGEGVLACMEREDQAQGLSSYPLGMGTVRDVTGSAIRSEHAIHGGSEISAKSDKQEEHIIDGMPASVWAAWHHDRHQLVRKYGLTKEQTDVAESEAQQVGMTTEQYLGAAADQKSVETVMRQRLESHLSAGRTALDASRSHDNAESDLAKEDQAFLSPRDRCAVDAYARQELDYHREQQLCQARRAQTIYRQDRQDDNTDRELVAYKSSPEPERSWQQNDVGKHENMPYGSHDTRDIYGGPIAGWDPPSNGLYASANDSGRSWTEMQNTDWGTGSVSEAHHRSQVDRVRKIIDVGELQKNVTWWDWLAWVASGTGGHATSSAGMALDEPQETQTPAEVTVGSAVIAE